MASYLFLRLIHLFQQIFEENPLHAKFYARHWDAAVNKAHVVLFCKNPAGKVEITEDTPLKY